MNTKDNQRSRLTRLLLKNAYLECMHHKQPGKITVKDICEAAQVNRSTFYLHFDEPNDILIALEDESIDQISEYLRSIGAEEEASPDVQNYLLSFFQYIRKNDETFRCLLVENNDPHFRRKLFDLTMELIPAEFSLDIHPELLELICRFIISGSIELLIHWVRTDYQIPDQQMGLLLNRLCEGSIKEALLP